MVKICYIFFFVRPSVCAFCLALSVLSACSSAERQAQQMHAEAQAGHDTAVWVLARYSELESADLSNYTTGLLARLTDGAAMLNVTASHVAYMPAFRVYVLDVPQPAAFSTAGATIFITRGLFRALNTEAELSSVLAHEMAHELLGHHRDILAKQSHKDSPLLSFSFEQELQADLYSLAILKASRYDLRAAPQALIIASKKTLDFIPLEAQQHLAQRLDNLQKQINSFSPFLPATQSSRAFNRIKRLTIH